MKKGERCRQQERCFYGEADMAIGARIKTRIKRWLISSIIIGLWSSIFMAQQGENRPPDPPLLRSPEKGAIVAVHREQFQLSSNDADGDPLKFKIVVIESVSPPQPPGSRGRIRYWIFDQTQDTTGWDKEAYASQEIATFTVPEGKQIPEGKYLWWALAYDGKEWSKISERRELQIVPNRPPVNLSLLSPDDNTIVSPTPTFKLKSEDPDGDDVKFVLELRKGEMVKRFETGFFASGSEATFTVMEELTSGQWMWRAKAIDTQGDESEWSGERSFIVNRLPSVPLLLEPAENAITSPTPTFKLKSEDPDGDRVKVVIELRFFSPFPPFEEFKSFESDFVSSGQEVVVTIPTEQALGSGEWVWRVKAVDEHGQESDYSGTKVIIVNRPPSVPELIEPEDNAVVPLTPTFRVKTVDPEDDPIMFVIEVKQGEIVKELKTEWTMPISPPIGGGGIPQEVTYTPAEPLGAGRWTWRVKAVDKKGTESEWSASKTFIVQVTVSNHPPTIPIVLTPSDNVVISPTPTFQVKAEDQEGDRLKYRFVFKQGQQTVQEFETADTFGSGQVVTLRLPENQTLRVGVYQWQVLAFDGKEWSEPSEIRTFIVSNAVPRRVRGLGTFGLSLQMEALTRKALGLVGLPMKVWNPSTQRYQDAGDTLELGRGYWFKAETDFPIALAGRLRTEEVTIPLQRGWNFISNPYLQEVVWDVNAIWVRKDRFLETLGRAQQAGWIEDYAWGWEQDKNDPNTGRYVLVYDTSIIPGVKGQLEPWKGYWVYAHTDCELILPPPSQSKGRGTRGEGRVAKDNGWSVRLQASVNGSVGEAVMGIASGTRGLAVGLPPEPPTGNNGVQVILLKNNTPLAVDVRSDGSRRQEWDVLVRWDKGHGTRGTGERKEVTLTFDGIGYAPKDVSAWLVDTVTGKRVYLRTQASYRFTPAVGETERRFKVIVESGNERPLRIVGLKATPMRGDGLVITFALTKTAQVRGEVMTLTGRKIAVMDDGSTRIAGTHRMIWRGVGSEGSKVPIGAYLVRLVATDEDGRQVQAMTLVRSK